MHVDDPAVDDPSHSTDGEAPTARRRGGTLAEIPVLS